MTTYLTPPIRGGTTPFGAGFGGRMGGSIAGVYLGARAIGFLGGRDIDVTDQAVLYGGEVGYGLRLRMPGMTFLTVRPTLGVGAMTVIHTDPSLLSPTAATTTRAGTLAASTGVDVVTGATGGAATSGGSRTAAGPSDTTTVTSLYFDPGLTLLYSASVLFVGANANMLVVPQIAYGGGEPSTWLAYGLQAEIGFFF